MRKKRSSKLKYLIIITVIISLFYLILYLYSSGHFFIERSCPKEGGTCKSSCNPWEIHGLSCSQNNICCIPFEKDRIKVAMENRDISICQFISSTAAKKACEVAVLDMVDSDTALNYKDAKYCENIKNPSIKNSCFNDLALETNNQHLCDYISEGKDSCYLNFINSENDKPICDKISSNFNKDSCLKKIAILTQDLTICPQLNIYSESYDCFKEVELRKRAPFNVECSNLIREECEKLRGCKPILINELKQDYSAYAGCSRDEELFCTLTGGSWEDLPDVIMQTVEQGCNCKDNKVYYRGYGCFDCDIFSNQDVREDCKTKL